MDKIARIRQEIERLKVDYLNRSYTFVPTAMNQLLEFLDTLSEEPDNDDLNEEIKKLIEKYGYERGGDRLLIAIVARHFAEWQKERDLAEMAQSRSPLSVAYANRCFENGKQAMKEEMLKDAIHYVIQDDLDSHGASYNIPFIRIGTTALKPKGIGVGDKVKVIVLKEEE